MILSKKQQDKKSPRQSYFELVRSRTDAGVCKLLAAQETVVAAPDENETAEGQFPATAAPGEARDEQVAVRVAQKRAREHEVLALELDRDFRLVVQKVLRVSQPEVGLEADRSLTQHLAVDVALATLQERDHLEVADLEIGRSDVLDDFPSRGDEEVGGEDLTRESHYDLTPDDQLHFGEHVTLTEHLYIGVGQTIADARQRELVSLAR